MDGTRASSHFVALGRTLPLRRKLTSHVDRRLAVTLRDHVAALTAHTVQADNSSSVGQAVSLAELKTIAGSCQPPTTNRKKTLIHRSSGAATPQSFDGSEFGTFCGLVPPATPESVSPTLRNNHHDNMTSRSKQGSPSEMRNLIWH